DALPDVNFDAFAASVSAALEAEDAYAPAPIPMWPVWRRRLAMVAAVALTGAAVWPFVQQSDRPAGPTGTAIVTGPALVTPTTAPTAVVQVGPSEVMVQRGFAMGLGTEKQSPAQPKVVISSAEPNGDVRPY
ncbi:MAG TPA: hypothetical protein VF595_06785, partial [Tepidisphaeraceae bacterium]